MEREMDNKTIFINEVFNLIKDNGERAGEKLLWFKDECGDWHQVVQCEAESYLDGIPLGTFKIEDYKGIVKDLIEKDCYNSYAEENIPKDHRAGIINRRDMWEAVPAIKGNDFSGLKADMVSDFYFYFRLNEERWGNLAADSPVYTTALYVKAIIICRRAVSCEPSKLIRPVIYQNKLCLEFAPSHSLTLSVIITAFNALVSNQVLLRVECPNALFERIEGRDEIGVVPKADVIDEEYRRVINGSLPRSYINPWQWDEEEIKPLLKVVKWEEIPDVSLKESEETGYEEE